jgi:hypothetical protein
VVCHYGCAGDLALKCRRGRVSGRLMNYAYSAVGWHDLYVCAGGAAAALLGLLFVALTLRLEAIVRDRRWRGITLGSLISLSALLFVSILVLIPSQPSRLLGAELFLIGCAFLAYAVRYIIGSISRGRPVSWGNVVLVYVGFLLISLIGLSLVLHRFGGLLWLPVAVLTLFASSLHGAWRLVIGIGQESSASPNHP